ncbi:MAG: diacylglycerol kinase family protein [Kiritimatiellae bacterium]|nr:diacylglycerol kinase family protein [Kiritimatiellia bacterium]
MRHVLVLVNPGAGSRDRTAEIRVAMREHWEGAGRYVSIESSYSADDGRDKACAAIADGADTVLVAGGDGMINSLLPVLAKHDVTFGVIPTGSGNGFARHFDIPLDLSEAIASLRRARPRSIDMGCVAGIPFVVTCSFACEAAIVESFESFPVRGVLPYVFSTVYQAFKYEPQPTTLYLEDNSQVMFEEPIIFTFANLSQYGGGAVISPTADPCDGMIELVVVERKVLPGLLLQIPNILAGDIKKLTDVYAISCRKARVVRENPAPIQIDGELVDAPASVTVEVKHQALKVLIPQRPQNQ